MIEKFLKAKHWQVFLVIFIIPYSLQFLISTIIENDHDKMMRFTPLIMIILYIGLFGWFWSIGIGLKEKVPVGVKMKINKFKTFLIIPVIYIPFSMSLMKMLLKSNGDLNATMSSISIVIIFTLHILSMFGMFYSFYFVAKTLRTIELQKEVTFSDFAGEFFLLLFFPIGVWLIQPRIHKIIYE